jgi:hypothetical protein
MPINCLARLLRFAIAQRMGKTESVSSSLTDLWPLVTGNGGTLYSERQTEERGRLARRICRRHTFSEVASEKQRPQGTLGMPCAAKTTGAGNLRIRDESNGEQLGWLVRERICCLFVTAQFLL